MGLSKNLGDYTVKQYMDFVRVFNSTHQDQLAKNIALMSVLTGKSEDYYNTLPTKELTKAISKLPVFNLDGVKFPIHRTLFINLRIYKGITDIQDLSSDRYRDIKAYSERGIDKHLAELLACIYYPLFNKKHSPKVHKRLTKLMLNQKLKNVAGLVFFYSVVFKRLSQIIETSLEMDLKKAEEMMKELKKELDNHKLQDS